MPNHVAHKLTCTGCDRVLESMVEAISRKPKAEGEDDPGAAIDFARIVPPPPFLFDDSLGMEEQAAHPNRNWYDWNVKRWGTKWNCYRASIEQGRSEVVIRFETAWSVPEPVLEQLSFLFPEIEFRAEFIDEGWNFSGVIKYEGGRKTEEEEIKCESSNEKFSKLHEIVYGRPIEEDDDE